ncbi:MAG: GH39 family glycosyl hydrolase [Bacteroidales bacterium]
MKKFFFLFILIFSLALYTFSQADTGKSVITVDFSRESGDFKPVWAWFGYDEPNYTYMPNGKKLLSELAAMSPVPVHIRVHNLLTSGDGTPALKWGSTNVYTEDENGNPVYDWRIIDTIFDTWIERGIKPLVEIGFMPEALSSKPQPYRHFWKPGDPYDNIYTGWVYPPKDYEKWAELVYQWVLHSIERYGTEEVELWYWELWNEPDIKYWGGTLEEYCKLYDYTAWALKRALPSARIGAPHTTNPGNRNASMFLRNFLNHCDTGINHATGGRGTPLDFIVFHAKGAPVVMKGFVRMNMGTQLYHISKGFEIVASHPVFRNLPVIIGECDPEGCAACSMDIYPQNSYRNGTMYSSYTASSFAKIFDLASHYNINLEGIVSWSFEFENQPWFHGFRDLATNGVDKPVLNVFRMFGMMEGRKVEAVSDAGFTFSQVIDSGVRGSRTDLGVLATRKNNSATVMIWNYHDDDLKAPDSNFKITLKGLPSKKAGMSEYMIDSRHSNSYEIWKKMGSPQNPDPTQVARLEKAGMLEITGKSIVVSDGSGNVSFSGTIERQGVILYIFRWEQ